MKIFAARLSPNTTAESLQALFEQFGEVTSSKVIMDRETGRSKCYGFVEMADDEQGRQAVEALNGVEYEGSAIATKEAVPHEDYKKAHSNYPQHREGGYQRRDNYSDRGGYRTGGYEPREDNDNHQDNF